MIGEERPLSDLVAEYVGAHVERPLRQPEAPPHRLPPDGRRDGGTAMSDDILTDPLLPLLRRIWNSTNWSGEVVISVSPEKAVEVFWRGPGQKDEHDYSPDAVGLTITEALTTAALQADLM